MVDFQPPARRPSLYHFRTHEGGGREVDIVLEAPDGEIVGIEVKAGRTVTSDDLKGLRALGAAAGDRFLRGVVLYQGDETVPFTPNLHAVPMDVLWR